MGASTMYLSVHRQLAMYATQEKTNYLYVYVIS